MFNIFKKKNNNSYMRSQYVPSSINTQTAVNTLENKPHNESTNVDSNNVALPEIGHVENTLPTSNKSDFEVTDESLQDMFDTAANEAEKLNDENSDYPESWITGFRRVSGMDDQDLYRIIEESLHKYSEYKSTVHDKRVLETKIIQLLDYVNCNEVWSQKYEDRLDSQRSEYLHLQKVSETTADDMTDELNRSFLITYDLEKFRMDYCHDRLARLNEVYGMISDLSFNNLNVYEEILTRLDRKIAGLKTIDNIAFD